MWGWHNLFIAQSSSPWNLNRVRKPKFPQLCPSLDPWTGREGQGREGTQPAPVQLIETKTCCRRRRPPSHLGWKLVGEIDLKTNLPSLSPQSPTPPTEAGFCISCSPEFASGWTLTAATRWSLGFRSHSFASPSGQEMWKTRLESVLSEYYSSTRLMLGWYLSTCKRVPGTQKPTELTWAAKDVRTGKSFASKTTRAPTLFWGKEYYIFLHRQLMTKHEIHFKLLERKDMWK